MDPMKRVRLAVLFLMVAALLASTPVFAAPKPKTPGPPDFVLSPVGDEPNASGEAWVYYDSPGENFQPAPYLSVKCHGLTPGATYRVDVRVYHLSGVLYFTVFETTANKKGAFKGDGFFYDPWVSMLSWVYEDSVLVYRVEPTEDVLVLSATRYVPW